MFRTDLLKSKRILITGGGTGLGKGMAQRFLELGAEVYICGRREEVLKQTAAELSPKGSIHALPCDVRNLDAVEAMIDSLWSAGPLDVLVNNAAGPIPTQGAFSRVLPRPELETHALERNPLHRFGTVEELANLAAFLVSDGSRYINGEVIRMDGGEFLQGAGEFSNLGRALTDKDWESLKPRKKGGRV